jgi:hypothetical protein
MNIYLFTLFGACLVFAGFNIFLNSKTSHSQIRIISMLFILAGLIGAFSTLALSFIRLFGRVPVLTHFLEL